LNPHEKESRVGIVVLSGFFNVASTLKQKARDTVNDAGFVFTR
jgi:hypothetical protein